MLNPPGLSGEPQNLLSFPWEKKKPEHTKAAPAISKEDALKRFEEVAKKTERNQ